MRLHDIRVGNEYAVRPNSGLIVRATALEVGVPWSSARIAERYRDSHKTLLRMEADPCLSDHERVLRDMRVFIDEHAPKVHWYGVRVSYQDPLNAEIAREETVRCGAVLLEWGTYEERERFERLVMMARRTLRFYGEYGEQHVDALLNGGDNVERTFATYEKELTEAGEEGVRAQRVALQRKAAEWREKIMRYREKELITEEALENIRRELVLIELELEAVRRDD